jgi:hypothetical protein
LTLCQLSLQQSHLVREKPSALRGRIDVDDRTVTGHDGSSNARRKIMTYRRTYDPTNRAEVFATLRREILAARLKITLDEQLDRPTSPKVKLLAQMRLPPLVMPCPRVDGETKCRTYDPATKDRVFATLRREILAARLKVTLDEQPGRETSPTVIRLSKMKLPPIVRPSRSGEFPG